MVNDPVLICGDCGHEESLPDSPDFSSMSPMTILPGARHPVIVHHEDGSHDFMWDLDR